MTGILIAFRAHVQRTTDATPILADETMAEIDGKVMTMEQAERVGLSGSGSTWFLPMSSPRAFPCRGTLRFVAAGTIGHSGSLDRRVLRGLNGYDP